MRRSHFLFAMAALALLLSGCGTTIKSEVTAFHEWPLYLRDKTYVFERSKDQENNLEYRNYENLVRAELKRLGFAEASDAHAANLQASMGYDMEVRDVRAVYPVVVDPYWPGTPWRGYYSPFYGPFYDPFWYGPPIVEQREENYQLFTRRFKFSFSEIPDDKMVYQVTVVSKGRKGSLAAVMPYMVRAAFADFPGKSGVPRVVELKMK